MFRYVAPINRERQLQLLQTEISTFFRSSQNINNKKSWKSNFLILEQNTSIFALQSYL